MCSLSGTLHEAPVYNGDCVCCRGFISIGTYTALHFLMIHFPCHCLGYRAACKTYSCCLFLICPLTQIMNITFHHYNIVEFTASCFLLSIDLFINNCFFTCNTHNHTVQALRYGTMTSKYYPAMSVFLTTTSSQTFLLQLTFTLKTDLALCSSLNLYVDFIIFCYINFTLINYLTTGISNCFQK